MLWSDQQFLMTRLTEGRNSVRVEEEHVEILRPNKVFIHPYVLPIISLHETAGHSWLK